MPRESLVGLQILVVDDTVTMAEQYAYDLKRVGGYQTTIAGGGSEGLEILAREPIDCIILDLEMPGTDGFEVLRRLQQSGIDIPVIVYTGTGSYERCVQAMRLGAHGFVDKAEPIERVVQEIEHAVSRGHLVKELRRLDGDEGRKDTILRYPVPIRALAVSPDSDLVASGSFNGEVKVWKLSADKASAEKSYRSFNASPGFHGAAAAAK